MGSIKRASTLTETAGRNEGSRQTFGFRQKSRTKVYKVSHYHFPRYSACPNSTLVCPWIAFLARENLRIRPFLADKLSSLATLVGRAVLCQPMYLAPYCLPPISEVPPVWTPQRV